MKQAVNYVLSCITGLVLLVLLIHHGLAQDEAKAFHVFVAAVLLGVLILTLHDSKE